MMSKIHILLILLFTAAMMPSHAQNKIILELKRPATVGASIPVKFKRYKKDKLKKFNDKHLVVKLSAGRYENKRIILPHNVDNIQNHGIKVSFNLAKQPNIWYDTILYVDYSGDIFANFSGKDGHNGDNKDQKLGLFLIGRDGGSGNDGDDGGEGKDGEDIDVFLDVYYDSLLEIDLLRAKIVSKSSSLKGTYLVNTKTGKLSISANGGTGGDGGRGGGGGDGKRAKAPTEKKSAKSPGCGGDGGNGGNGGNGGKGGSIVVIVKDSAKPYMHLISMANEGGKNGQGGHCGAGGDGGSGGYGYSDEEDGKDGDNGRDGTGGNTGIESKIVSLDH